MPQFPILFSKIRELHVCLDYRSFVLKISFEKIAR